jgi:hypothetical protein
MLKKLVLMSALPLSLLVLAQPAEARRLFWWESINPDAPPPRYYDPQQDAYGDPYSQDQMNQREYDLYRREMARRYGNAAYNQDPGPDYGYDAPPPPYADPVYPSHRKKLKPKFTAVKPVAKSPPKVNVAKMAVPAPGANDGVAAITASTTPAAKPATTTVASVTADKPKSGGAVSCDKGQGIVSSFGFSNVSSKSCDSKTLVYSAERGGNKFEVEVNSANGELTAVKKL